MRATPATRAKPTRTVSSSFGIEIVIGEERQILLNNGAYSSAKCLIIGH